MSIVRMRKVFRSTIKVKAGRKHLNLPSIATIIFGAIVVIFVVGAYFTFGAPPSGPGAQHEAVGQSAGVVAVVNGRKIQRAVFERAVAMAYERSEAKGIAVLGGIRQQALDGLIEELLVRDAAKAEGIRVSAADIAAKREELVQQRINSQFPDKKALRDYLARRNMTREQMEAEQRERLPDDETMREIIAREKLQELAESRVQVSDQDLLDSYTTAKYQPIMVVPQLVAEEHKKQWEAEHAHAHAPGNAEVAPVQTSEPPKIDADAIARQKADELLGKIRAGTDFAAVAKGNPYDPFGEAAGGVQEMLPGQLPASMRDLEKAVFALKPGEVSEVIKAGSAYYIVRVTERSQKLPKDFEKSKETYRARLLEQRKHAAWDDYLQSLRQAASIEIRDPEMRGREFLRQGRIQEAEQALQQAVKEDPQNLSAIYTLGALYADSGRKDEAIAMLQKVTAQAEGAQDPMIHLRLGMLYVEQGQPEAAIVAFQNASEWAGASDYMNFTIHLQLKQQFTELKRPELAAKEDEWIAEFEKNNQGMFGGLPGGTLTIPPPASGE